MRFLSTTPCSQSKLPLQVFATIIFFMSSLVFLPVALCWWAQNNNNNNVLWRRRSKAYSNFFLYFFVLHSVIFFIPWELSTGVKKIIIITDVAMSCRRSWLEQRCVYADKTPTHRARPPLSGLSSPLLQCCWWTSTVAPWLPWIRTWSCFHTSIHTIRLVAWHSGRTSVSDWRTFPVLRSTCSWWVTTNVGKPSATGHPTIGQLSRSSFLGR